MCLGVMMTAGNSEGWYETGRGVVVPWKCDHFGHMNVRFYAEAFDDASFHIWSVIGIPVSDLEDQGLIGVVASLKIDFLQEITVGQLYLIESAITRIGGKSFTYRERMIETHTGAVHATADMVEVFFDKQDRKAAPIPDRVRTLLEAKLLPEEDS